MINVTKMVDRNRPFLAISGLDARSAQHRTQGRKRRKIRASECSPRVETGCPAQIGRGSKPGGRLRMHSDGAQRPDRRQNPEHRDAASAQGLTAAHPPRDASTDIPPPRVAEPYPVGPESRHLRQGPLHREPARPLSRWRGAGPLTPPRVAPCGSPRPVPASPRAGSGRASRSPPPSASARSG